MRRKFIILLLFILQFFIANGQIKDGAYIEISPVFYDVLKILIFKKNSIKWLECSIVHKDSTMGRWKVANDSLYLYFDKQPPDDPDLIKVYTRSEGKTDYLHIKVRDFANEPAGGVNVISVLRDGSVIPTFTDTSGNAVIVKSNAIVRLNFSFVGLESLSLGDSIFNKCNIDSICIKLKNSQIRYIERENCVLKIRDINRHGFEICIEPFNRYIQYLRSDFYGKLIKRHIILSKGVFSQDEYENILKY